MRRAIPILLVTLSIGAIASLALRLVSAADSESLSRGSDVLLEKDADLLLGIVPTRTTLASLFRQQGIDGAQSAALISAISSSFDLRRLRAGQPYAIDRLLDGRIRRFEYEIDGDRRLELSRASLDGAPRFIPAIERIAKVTTVVTVEGEINRQQSSLTAALDKAGERIELALGLADLFSGEIDFSSDLQPGDHFRLVVERQTREGKPAGYGAILAAEFSNDGRNLTAVRFTPDGGSPGYYDAQGRSIKRFFLKSPLKFEPRISSRFSSSRMHPLLGYARAHNGVDYGAPSGAPVGSVAPGVVSLAGWTSGGGRTVRVRHPNGYESEYMHLSAISVRAGARVGQGDLIGRVGMTGLATGPHLHYGLLKNGHYVNPVIEHRNMPPGEPVPSALLATFNSERDHVLSLLSHPSQLRAANN